MPTTVLETADAAAHEMADAIMRDHHPELQLPDGSFPTVRIQFAFGNANSDEPVLTKHGRRVLGTIKVVPYDERVDDRRDIVMQVDHSAWDDKTENQRRALLDGLITYVEVQKDKDGIVKTDDKGRPKLCMRQPDFFLEGFRSNAQRYGSDAPEVIAARAFRESYGDVVFADDKLFA